MAKAQDTTRTSVTSCFDTVKIILESPAGDRTIAAVPEYRKFKEARDEHTHEHIIKERPTSTSPLTRQWSGSSSSGVSFP